jgi:hypothetical protein
MRTTYFPTLTLAGLMLITACSSTPRAALVTTTTATTIELPSSTSPPSTTTVAATTTTTDAPPPTTPPDVITAIKQTILDAETVRFECLQDASTCDPATYSRGLFLASERQFVATAVSRNAKITRRDGDPSYWVFEEVIVNPEGTSATVVACRWDTAILVGEGGAIINDDNITYHARVTLEFDSDKWWIANDTFDSRVDGRNDCAPQQ